MYGGKPCGEGRGCSLGLAPRAVVRGSAFSRDLDLSRVNNVYLAFGRDMEVYVGRIKICPIKFIQVKAEDCLFNCKDVTEFLCSVNRKNSGTFVIEVQCFSVVCMHADHCVPFGIVACMHADHCVPFRYEMQDLHVTETLPQMVALSEAYMQIYEQQE
ncbi:hypothetical protein BHE74_00046388 [Ensete ventricosum]|nr:hypothetical protein BHE74_00046388 [Ensete ventricosum]